MKQLIRPETSSDAAMIRAVHEAAFGGPDEADLVEALRRGGELILSLVAETAGVITGHVAFSRLVPADGSLKASALAPVAVLPGWQRTGVGSALVRDGLDRLSARGEDVVLVLGEPDYYSRFGFSVEAARVFRTPYDGPYLQAVHLHEAVGAGGELSYARAFSGLG